MNDTPDETQPIEPIVDDDGPSTNTIVALVAGLVVLLIIGAGYLLWASGRVDNDVASREARAQAAIADFEATDSSESAASVGAATATVDPANAADLDEALQPGDVVVVHRVPGNDYGRLAIRRPDGSRTLLDRRCERVHVAVDRGVCLALDEAVLLPAFRTEFFEATTPGLPEIRAYNSPLPSRARMSPDGTSASTTGFVSGSSYADVGGEAATVVTVDKIDERAELVGLIAFEVLADNPDDYSGEGQFWGMTWVDNDAFWVTGHFGDEPELLQGNVTRRTLEPTGLAGSCPSVSPDGRHLVYKSTNDDGSFSLTVRDLESGEEWLAGEQRSVDDQVEWLDNDTILYALHAEESAETDVQPQFDIWTVDIAPGSEPTLFLPAADSPAVLR